MEEYRQKIGLCIDCEQPIYEGDECAVIDGEYYHLDCVDSKSIRELLELTGNKVMTADCY